MAAESPDAQVSLARIATLGRELLEAIGENPGREGLRETPLRWARFWQEFITYQPGNLDATFEVTQADEMVTVSGIRVWSLCEHHLLPFWADIAIGYITHSRVLGLSKFARIAQACAHRLQIQERMVQDIADEIEAYTNTVDVAVLAVGHHTCMLMRGVRQDAIMTTSAMHGAFRSDPATRAEFLRLVRHDH